MHNNVGTDGNFIGCSRTGWSIAHCEQRLTLVVAYSPSDRERVSPFAALDPEA
jgi:hypothetical protein